MAVSQAMIAEAVTRDFPFRRYRRVLDVGGGTGTFLEHVARAAPAAALTLFDLPPVAAAAADRMTRKGLGDRLRCIGGDFTADPLPRGHDLITLVRVVDGTLKAGMKILRPLLAETGAEQVGKMVIGTVKGDIHDIGKNLVGMMMEGAGFEVIDLGINNPVENYLDALKEHEPDILGMSALLTTTMPYMKVVIDTMKDMGIRDDYVILVGGAPLNEAFAEAIGADAYCRDAAVAVETAKDFMARKHNQRGARRGGESGTTAA